MKKFICALAIITIAGFGASVAFSANQNAEKGQKAKVKKEAKQQKEDKAKEAKSEAKAKKEEKGKKKAEAKTKLEDPKKIAKEAFDSGKKKFDTGDYKGALDDFIKANDTLPNPFVYLKIADCHEKLGNLQDALVWLKKFVDEKPDAVNINEIKSRIETLEKTPGKVAVSSEPEGAKIFIDKQDTGKTTPAEVEAPPGEHTVELILDGYAPSQKTFAVAPGTPQEIKISLEKMTPPPVEMIAEEYPEEAPKPEQPVPAPQPQAEEVAPVKVNKGVYATAGIAGAGIISATVFGILALNKEAEFEDEKDKGKKEGESQEDYLDRLDDIKSRGKIFAIACDASWAVAAAATITGIILYYVTGSSPKEGKTANVKLVPMVNPAGGGAGAVINF